MSIDTNTLAILKIMCSTSPELGKKSEKAKKKTFEYDISPFAGAPPPGERLLQFWRVG